MSSSCERGSDATPEPAGPCTRTGYVIGAAPCNPAGKLGLILALEAPYDTVYTYNLPAEIFTYSPTLPVVRGGRGVSLFAPSIRAGSKFKLGYRLTPANERSYGICNAAITTEPFEQMTRNQEITVLCTSK